MYWENLEGMFTFDALYGNMVQKFPSNSLFVEIGTWKGKSAVFMAEKIKESHKSIRFCTIDSFDGFGDGYNDDRDFKNHSLLETYTKNIEPVKSLIETFVGFSFDFASKFEDESIDFLFLDGEAIDTKELKKIYVCGFQRLKKEELLLVTIIMNRLVGLEELLMSILHSEQNLIWGDAGILKNRI
jgi:hypothetical protein